MMNTIGKLHLLSVNILRTDYLLKIHKLFCPLIFAGPVTCIKIFWHKNLPSLI